MKIHLLKDHRLVYPGSPDDQILLSQEISLYLLTKLGW